VWRTGQLLATTDEGTAFLELCRRLEVTEVYLSLPGDILRDPRLLPFLRALRASGIRIEALLGDATWYLPEKQAQLLSRIGEVTAFNTGHPKARFDGIHLDIEPHQLASNKGRSAHTYLPLLARNLEAAVSAAGLAGLGVTADVPRKFFRGGEEDWTALRLACPTLALMLYDGEKGGTGVTIAERVTGVRRDFLEAAGTGSGALLVGLRCVDQPDQVADLLSAVEAALSGHGGFAGVAIHDYRTCRGEGRAAPVPRR
jgi:hypothetical protein